MMQVNHHPVAVIFILALSLLDWWDLPLMIRHSLSFITYGLKYALLTIRKAKPGTGIPAGQQGTLQDWSRLSQQHLDDSIITRVICAVFCRDKKRKHFSHSLPKKGSVVQQSLLSTCYVPSLDWGWQVAHITPPQVWCSEGFPWRREV